MLLYCSVVVAETPCTCLICTQGLGMGSLADLEHARAVLRAALVEEVPFDVFVTEETLRIDVVENPDEVFKTGIQPAQVVACERVRFCPMWAAFVACENRFEAFEELTVRHVQAVRPERRGACNRQWETHGDNRNRRTCIG